MVSANVIISKKAARYCGVYVHEVPKLVLLINKKPHLFIGDLNSNRMKEFIQNQLPAYTILPVRIVSV